MSIPGVTIEQLRVRIGLDEDDASKDEALEAASTLAFDMVEEYLDRKLMYEADTEDLFGPLHSILTRRWPLDPIMPVVVSINDGRSENATALSHVQTDYHNGIIYLGGYHSGFPIRVEYTGGYDDLPPILLWACLQVFDAVWASDPSFGGSTGGDVWADGAIKKVSLVGIGSVDLGASAGGSGTGGDGISDPWSLISAPVIDLLNRFRRQSTIGAG